MHIPIKKWYMINFNKIAFVREKKLVNDTLYVSTPFVFHARTLKLGYHRWVCLLYKVWRRSISKIKESKVKFCFYSIYVWNTNLVFFFFFWHVTCHIRFTIWHKQKWSFEFWDLRPIAHGPCTIILISFLCTTKDGVEKEAHKETCQGYT